MVQRWVEVTGSPCGAWFAECRRPSGAPSSGRPQRAPMPDHAGARCARPARRRRRLAVGEPALDCARARARGAGWRRRVPRADGRVRSKPASGDRPPAAARRDPAHRVVARRGAHVPRLGRDRGRALLRLGAEVEPVLVHDAPRAMTPRPSRPSARPTWSTCPVATRATCSRALRIAAGPGPGERARARRGRRRLLGGRDGDRRALHGPPDHPAPRLPLPFSSAGRRGLCLVEGVAVLPHYDAWPEADGRARWRSRRRGGPRCSGSTRTRRPSGRDGTWQVHGRGRVTMWRGRHRERFRRGEAFRL